MQLLMKRIHDTRKKMVKTSAVIKTLERTELKGGTLRVPTHNTRETFR